MIKFCELLRVRNAGYVGVVWVELLRKLESICFVWIIVDNIHRDAILV